MPETPIKEKRIPKALIALFLFILCAVLYKNSLGAGFVTDAYIVIVNNPIIKQPALYKRIFTEDLFLQRQKQTEKSLNYYRPVVSLTFALDYRMWRLNPLGYHLSNIILHAVNCFLIFIFLFALFRNQELALVASVLFCILPIQEWVVNYTVGRCDLLQLFFTMLSLISFISFLENNKLSRFLLSLAFFILAFLSREIGLILPIFIYLTGYFYNRDRKKALRYSLVFLVIGGLYFFFRLSFLPIVKGASIAQEMSFLARIMEWLAFSAAYMTRFVFPWVVQATIIPIAEAGAIKVIVAGCVILALFVYSCREYAHRRKEYLLFGWIWILLSFLPFFFMISQSWTLGPVSSEHYLYLSAVGFSVFLSGAILSFRFPAQRAILVLIVFYYCGVVVYNNSHWKDEYSLLRHVCTLEGNIRSIASKQISSQYELNEAALKRMIEEADDEGKKSKCWQALGGYYLDNGNYPQAVESFSQAIKLFSKDEWPYIYLASVYSKEKQDDLAVDYLLKALAINSESDDAYREIGIIYYGRRDYETAVSYLEKSSFYDPDNVDSLLYLGMSYFRLNQRDKAMPFLEEAVVLSKNDSFACRFIAAELYDQHYAVDALVFLKKAAQLFPRDSEIWLLLGKIYFNLHDIPKALAAWQNISKFDPANPELKACLEKVEALRVAVPGNP
ncbi:MAG TPA: tetratricopeptide repeat protein [Candidatus Omnitrophota bacterium]|nr:tetratricopeptide repeat protein [Candidatus Omnitrophota bacterium]HPD84418.1 tetratricopeptide repeat protein [Candidatus Omnitrophota bacterium]HRZ03276.1 tetratricopeptide repeat protein [Candidatus Omnitrophota bacterium]